MKKKNNNEKRIRNGKCKKALAAGVTLLMALGMIAPSIWASNGSGSNIDVMMVKDIYPGSIGSGPRYFAMVGSTLYFAAEDGTNGYELWKSDGTSAGTTMVKDIRPGAGYSSPAYLTVVGSTLYFRATDGTNGYELWKSDGTTAGTTMVKDIRPGAGNSNPDYFVVVGSTLYFAATDGTNGTELWKSDGTTAGTTMVKDIYPGSIGSGPRYFAAVGSTLYFQADDGTNGTELWKSDGTTAGTAMVKDINPGSSSSTPYGLVAVGSILYFQANDGTNGTELWKSDGTTAGTTMVKDIRPGVNSSDPAYFVVIDSTLYFRADDGTNGKEVWKSDGTSAGTTMVKDINPGVNGSGFGDLTVVGSTFYFRAFEDTYGYELWKSDGTTAGTTIVKDINPGGVNHSWPWYLAAFGNTLYFQATDGTNGVELWRTCLLNGWDSWSHPLHMWSISEGNVGIGTTSPTARLHVKGDFLVEGNPSPTLFCVDASNDCIGIGTNVFVSGFTVTIQGNASSNNKGIYVKTADNTYESIVGQCHHQYRPAGFVLENRYPASASFPKGVMMRFKGMDTNGVMQEYLAFIAEYVTRTAGAIDGDCWIRPVKNNAANWAFRFTHDGKLLIKDGGSASDVPESTLHVVGAINLDPIPAPAAPTTGFIIYCDQADGDLKAKSDTGIVTTIASD